MTSPPHPDPLPSRLRILLWPTIVALPGVALLLALGTWQLERLQWKSALIAEREAGLSAPAIQLEAVGPPYEALNFRRVAVRGEFLHEREFHLLSRTLNGRVGVHVITPLRLQPGRTGIPIVLVNRGWVPEDRTAPARRAEGQLPGIVDVEGFLRADTGRHGWFVPENDPAGGIWHRLDIDQMSEVLGLPVAPFVIEAGPAVNPGGFPIGGQTRLHLRNNHLEYALTWFTLAAAFAAVYLLFVSRELKRRTVGMAR